MKKRLCLLLTLLLLFTLVLGLGTSAPAGANTTRTASVNVSILNVRSGPGLQHTRTTQVTLGAVLPVLAEQPGWVQVALGGGKSGWVSAQYVTLKSTSAQSAKVTVSVLNVRSGPGTQYSRTTTVSQGTVLTVISKQGEWLQVKLPSGQTGWVMAQYTSVAAQPPAPQPPPVTNTPAAPVSVQPGTVAVVHVAILNVRSGPGITNQLLSTVSQDTKLTVLAKQGDWLQVSLPSGQSGWVAAEYTTVTTPAPTPSQPPVSNIPESPGTTEPETKAIVNINALNIRSGPSIEAPLVTTVPIHTEMFVQDKHSDWLQVSLPGGQSGWVYASYVTLVPSQPTDGGTTPTPTPAPAVQKMAVVTVSSLNARSGPSTDTQRITLLPQGATLPIINEQDDWLQVKLPSGDTAWIAGWYTVVFSQPVDPSGGGDVVPSGPSLLAGKIIVIDPGHGGANPGAIGYTGLPEKAVTLDVSLRVAALLRQAGATVIMTRDNDSTVYLAGRVAIAEAAGAHAFVSIHANAHPDRSVSGTETYYYRNQPNYLESYYLAAHLQNELVKALGLRDIGIKHGNFHVIRETTMPSALVELAFLSNPYDESLLKTDQFRANSAYAIFRGLERFFQF